VIFWVLNGLAILLELYMQFELITTTFQERKKQVNHQNVTFTPDKGIENNVVNLYPEIEYQTFEGFGGAFTDSAGYVFSLMSEPLKRRLLDAYFDPTEGAGYTLGRIHLDSCDFSLEHFEAVSDPKDETLDSFSLSRWEKYILPFIHGAQETPCSYCRALESAGLYENYRQAEQRRRASGRLPGNIREISAPLYSCLAESGT
jgi:glucosylceramidase